jgi:hypothetical protein
VDGNYSGNLRFMMNTPLKNKKFTINSMSMGSYSNSNSYVDDAESNTKSLTLMERAGIDYRSGLFDLGLNGNIRYNNIQYSLRPGNNQNTFNYGLGGTTAIYLYNMEKSFVSKYIPIVLESDITYSTNSGYSNEFKQKEVMWNASVSSKPFAFLKGNGTLRIKVYDILQQRSNISNSSLDNVYTESSSNTLTSYFIAHFIYRFSVFKGGASAADRRDQRRDFDGPGRLPGGPGGQGRPPRF